MEGGVFGLAGMALIWFEGRGFLDQCFGERERERGGVGVEVEGHRVFDLGRGILVGRSLCLLWL